MKKLGILLLLCLILTGCGKQVSIENDFNDCVNIGTYKHIVDIDDKHKDFSEEWARALLDEYLVIWNDTSYQNEIGIMEEGQTISVNYEIDGEKGAKEIVLGKEEILPGIDEELVGQKTGYILKKEIDGSQVKIITNYIIKQQEYTEATDAFVNILTNGSIKTVDDYIAYMCGEYADEIKCSYGNQALALIIENSEYRNIDKFVEIEYKNNYKEVKELAKDGWQKIYEQYNVKNKKELKEKLMEESENNVKQYLVLYKLSSMFEIPVDDDSLNEILIRLYELQL